MKNKGLLEKAKMFENNILIVDREITKLAEEMSDNAQQYIYDILDSIENKSIDLEHTNETTYILEELCYIDKVFICDKNVYVQYRLFDDLENGINEPFEERLIDIEPRGIKDIFYTIVQELKRVN